ncbi:MAG: biopolymer transporter ExbD [Syntrophorhabdus sp.]|jgi:biopolymer transport protein ExbD|nr:biopolymer transporter ExbD [Syntrophorhabdus sp.]
MEEKSFDYMNVIPLVDIMLVLLTIVLMVSTFVASGTIPVRLPVASQQNKEVQLKTATITIDRNNVIYFESTMTTLTGLTERVRDLARETPLIIKADQDITVQSCVNVLDLLTSAGFKKIGLQTEQGRTAKIP